MNVLNFDAKQCERTRRQLDSYLSNELLVETTSEVLRHLENCEVCSRELESRMRIREALRRAVSGRSVPEPLRAEVQRRLRGSRSGLLWQGSAGRWAVAVAALILVVLSGLGVKQWLRFREGGRMIARVLSLGAADHLHCAIQGHNYPEVPNPPDQVRQKLGPHYAGLLQVVEQRLPGFQVLEGHICSIPGSPRKYVHFIARGRGTILSVILTKREGESLPEGKFLVADASGGVNLYKAHLNRMDVVGFESKEYFGFVVSDLGQNEVLQIATALGPALRGALESRMVGPTLGPVRPGQALILAVKRLA
jgi:anti-sigma factor (TIGR02949 family)